MFISNPHLSLYFSCLAVALSHIHIITFLKLQKITRAASTMARSSWVHITLRSLLQRSEPCIQPSKKPSLSDSNWKSKHGLMVAEFHSSQKQRTESFGEDLKALHFQMSWTQHQTDLAAACSKNQEPCSQYQDYNR